MKNISKIIRIKFVLLGLLVLICTSCDLSTKVLAKKHLDQAPPVSIVGNYLELRYTENTAIAFSMLSSIEPTTRKWIIYSLSMVALTFLIILIWKVRHDSVLWLVSLMLILSGALGNIFERVFRGYVIDFIHLHYFDIWSWPIFNVADILITCGAILMGILMLFTSPNKQEELITE
ncbi:signal peptidase II [candidate division KSB1 bacterium 4572_119]|nr:MAG: signal peptidase II [candidate division KSB1 bacterium 4572_119]